MSLLLIFYFFTNICFAQVNNSFHTRIVGGQDATRGQFPFFAHIRIQYQYEEKGSLITDYGICGGSLISPSTVLTAAHCCLCYDTNNTSIFTITLNPFQQDIEQNFSAIENECTAQYITTKKNCHPNYADNDLDMSNDFCLLYLPTPSVYTPITVYDSTKLKLSPRPDTANTQVTIIGFGSTILEAESETLQKTLVPVADTTACADLWGPLLNPTVMICSNTSQGKNSCSGDSGSPMFTRLSTGNFLLLGIVSFGTIQCDNTEYPAVYARVDSASFRSWAYITAKPTRAPVAKPTTKPSKFPTSKPTRRPSFAPTVRPSPAPSSKAPTNPPGTPIVPSAHPTKLPTARPTRRPTQSPTTKAPATPPTPKSSTSLPPTTKQPTFQSSCVVNQYP